MENALVFEKQEPGHMICSKIVNFDRTEAGLTSKFQWCYQNCTVQQRTTSRDIA